MLDWLCCACTRKNKLYRTFAQYPSLETKAKYIKMKKFVTKHIRLAKSRYYKQYFERYSSDSKKQWQMINQLLNRKRKAKVRISKVDYKGDTIKDSAKIAGAFNDYFTNIAQKLKNQSGNGHGTQYSLTSDSRCNFKDEMFPNLVS